MEKLIFIKDIQQKDIHTLSIEWSNGNTYDYRLSDLQKQCPCANCNDEQTGKKIIDIKSIDENVSAKRVKSVGRYALKIEFTSGCSTGLYEFDRLYKLAVKIT